MDTCLYTTPKRCHDVMRTYVTTLAPASVIHDVTRRQHDIMYDFGGVDHSGKSYHVTLPCLMWWLWGALTNVIRCQHDVMMMSYHIIYDILGLPMSYEVNMISCWCHMTWCSPRHPMGTKRFPLSHPPLCAPITVSISFYRFSVEFWTDGDRGRPQHDKSCHICFLWKI